MNLTDEKILKYINDEFGDDLITCVKDEMKESIKQFLMNYQPLENEVDKPAADYTKEDLELLKQSFIKTTTEKRLELENRHNILFRDGGKLIHMLYKAMTEEERYKILRIKHDENQPLFEIIED
jgi:hypothetical protein